MNKHNQKNRGLYKNGNTASNLKNGARTGLPSTILRKNGAGFTLIELLVVIAIIGILSSVVIASLNTARAKARDVKRIAEVKQLMAALELYYDSNNGYYPTSSGGCGATSPNGGWCNSVESLYDSHWIRDNGKIGEVLSPFMSVEPTDPKQGSSPNWTPLNGGTIYYYASGYGGDGQWYMIIFGLENYPHPLEELDGVTACDGTYFHYGSGSNGVITLGARCAQ